MNVVRVVCSLASSHDNMLSSMLTDDLDVKISEETYSDARARDMRHNSDRGNIQCNLNRQI